ncbi:DUF3134 domain-containing protein [Synechococcales cyanobacterium C]|uniref:DUF3134 domain-containing protein n=1 Tax=Petrachloros mirabilis ULC683 TaxID=2781853 RepID=A0A8K1ZZK3_9CYAN|nr:DUF3134 family protein [Petrachloros mirabilis]NCJ06607.1 DUF3134 domain-containing protein [Petrachloros mirabilis ULC683]
MAPQNPSLREARITDLAPIIPHRRDASILNWLEGTGRLMEREGADRALLSDSDDMEEINALMSGDDADFEEDDLGGDDDD